MNASSFRPPKQNGGQVAPAATFFRPDSGALGIVTSEGEGATHALVTPKQVKAARRLLGWSQSGLGGQVGVSATTVWGFESGMPRSSALILDRVRQVLEVAGVEFITENGGGQP